MIELRKGLIVWVAYVEVKVGVRRTFAVLPNITLYLIFYYKIFYFNLSLFPNLSKNHFDTFDNGETVIL